MPAPVGTAEVERLEVNDAAEESSDASGWDDAWDDEDKWGDMEVRTELESFS